MNSQFSFSLYVGKKREVGLSTKDDITNILVLRILFLIV